MPKAHRHTRAARLVASPAPETALYEITDPAHTPDLHGEFAGAKVESSGGKQRVRLTAMQAKFYLDQGTLEAVVAEKPMPAKAEKEGCVMPTFDTPGESSFFSTINSMWPDLAQGRAPISPPRNGVNRYTGQLLSGWSHTEQSMEIIFETPFHERVLRRWVGSFVPLILGRSMVERIITRFFWAIASALDLWEPGYKVKQVHFMGKALQQWSPARDIGAPELIRLGHAIFRQEGVWYPRGHLGDYTPFAGRLFDYTAQGISVEHQP